MEVPLLDLGAQYRTLEQEMREAVLDVLASTKYIMGPAVGELENAIAAYCECEHAVGVSSGTDALLAALMALDLAPGDMVVTTPYSFFATAGCVTRLGGQPIFVDIDPVSFNIDPAALAAWFERNPADARRVRAIIPVHLYGQAADLDAIDEVAQKHGVAVIEDAAQAIGTTYPGASGTVKVGSRGIAGCFSFFPSKNLGGIGDGGMITTNNGAFAEKLRKLRNHGAQPKYYHSLIGGNFRLDTIQAAALLVKLRHLESWHEGRRVNAARYDEGFAGSPVETPVCVYGREHHIYNQYVIRVPERRDELRAHLQQQGIGNEVYYPVPFHLQECFVPLGYKQGDFPHSEDAAARSVALPIYPELTPEMIDYVIETVRGFYA